MTLYAAPEAGKYFADSMGGMTGLAEDLEQGLTGTDMLGELGDSGASLAEPGGSNPIADAMKDFKGLAVAVRFDDGALEVEAAGDTGLELLGVLRLRPRGRRRRDPAGRHRRRDRRRVRGGLADPGRRADGVLHR